MTSGPVVGPTSIVKTVCKINSIMRWRQAKYSKSFSSLFDEDACAAVTACVRSGVVEGHTHNLIRQSPFFQCFSHCPNLLLASTSRDLGDLKELADSLPRDEDGEAINVLFRRQIRKQLAILSADDLS